MTYRTITTVRMRDLPSLQGSVVANIAAQTLLQSVPGSAIVDNQGIHWVHVTHSFLDGWVALAAANGTPLLNGESIEYSVLFNISVAFVLQFEGGLSENEMDPGGLTKYGISQRAYPALGIRNLTLEQAVRIYHDDYWLKCDADKLPDKLAIQHFDMAVNAGIGRANIILEQSAGDYKKYSAMRSKFYKSIPYFAIFGEGWLRRSEACLALAEIL